MPPMTKPTSLPFTGDTTPTVCSPSDPLALLIGFALDQQVTVQKAFSGPVELQAPDRPSRCRADRRPWTTGRARCAVFRERPALHRFPGSMAGKVQALCAAIATDYGNDAARGLERGGRRPRPRAAAPRPAGDRRDEGQVADRRPRQAGSASDRPGYEDGRADLADARRRRLGRGARDVPGRQASPQGRRCERPRGGLDQPGRGHHSERRAGGGRLVAALRTRPHRSTSRRPGAGRASRAGIEIVFHSSTGGSTSPACRTRTGSGPGCSTSRRTRISPSTSRARSRPTCRRPRGWSRTRPSGGRCSPRSSRSGRAGRRDDDPLQPADRGHLRGPRGLRPHARVDRRDVAPLDCHYVPDPSDQMTPRGPDPSPPQPEVRPARAPSRRAIEASAPSSTSRRS